MTTRCLAVTGGGSVAKFDRLCHYNTVRLTYLASYSTHRRSKSFRRPVSLSSLPFSKSFFHESVFPSNQLRQYSTTSFAVNFL